MCLSPEHLCQSWEVVGGSFSLEPQNGFWTQPSPLSDTGHSDQPTARRNWSPMLPQNAQFFLQPELSCFPSKNLELELQEATNAGQENKKVVFEGTQYTPSSLVTVPEPSLVSHMVTRAGLSPDPETQSVVC